MNKSLQDKVALVTGAGSGIGKSTALKLAEEGARVALLGRTKGELTETADEVRAEGGRALELLADVAEVDSIKEAFAELEKEFKHLDIVVANAGVNGVWAPLEQITVEEWDQTQAINVRGTFLTIRQALPLLKARSAKGGSITVVASVNGTRIFSNTGATAYSCSKAAQVAMVKMLAVELGPFRIRINVICPGAISTGIADNTRKRNVEAVRISVEYPQGAIPLTGDQPGKPEDVADLIWFLASDHARHMTGSEIYIDGAQSLLQG
jgi:NAD(P)-dependent dehydrogenase (short-subunit alcohol dehydrogenase family)